MKVAKKHERGILMSGWSVGRILADAKTQTRRPLKDQFTEWPRWWCDWRERDGGWSLYDDLGNHLPGYPELRCPYGPVGRILYVKETWAISDEFDEVKPSSFDSPNRLGMSFWYKADDSKVNAPYNDRGRWRSPRFMPKWAAREWLRVTDIRVEQVQEISEVDAIAEGIDDDTCGGSGWMDYDLGPEIMHSVPAEYSFKTLYDSIYAKSGRGWDKNEWIFAYTFERTERKEK